MPGTYRTITEITDYGPYITKLILPMPAAVRSQDIAADTFRVYVERKDKVTGEILNLKKDWFTEETRLSKGYCDIADAYASDAGGNRLDEGAFVVLAMDARPMGGLNASISHLKHNVFVFSDFRITQVKAIATEHGEISGLIYDRCSGNRSPQLDGWLNSESTDADMPMRYGFFAPKTGTGTRPLIIWLHGAGEGGYDTAIAYAGNNVVNLSSDRIQRLFGGAYVLAPQAPTMWMDDGSGEYTQGGKSMYVKALKSLIDEFISLHADIDLERLYIGGCSNGGFMTMRMIIDYPGFFAAAYPVCEALFDATISDSDIVAIKDTPLWFVHAKNDSIVKPELTVVPTYGRLVEAGAANIHFSYYEKVVDPTGRFRDADGNPLELFGHAAWLYMLQDQCTLDFDGRPVMLGGQPVTLLQWLAAQKMG